MSKVTGDEKCAECKQSPFPRGFEPTMRKCWFCAVPHPILVLSPAQKAVVREALAR